MCKCIGKTICKLIYTILISAVFAVGLLLCFDTYMTAKDFT